MSAENSEATDHPGPGPHTPARSTRDIPTSSPERSAEAASGDQLEAVTGALEASGDLIKQAVARSGLGFQLVLAETRLAAMSFVRMLFLAVLAAVLVLGAWGVLASGATIALHEAGLPLWSLLSGVGLIHLLAAAWLIHRIRRLSAALDYPESRALILGAKSGDNASGNHNEAPRNEERRS